MNQRTATLAHTEAARARVKFNRRTQADAWSTARLLKRLTPWERRAVRLLAEAFLAGHVDAEAENGGD